MLLGRMGKMPMPLVQAVLLALASLAISLPQFEHHRCVAGAEVWVGGV